MPAGIRTRDLRKVYSTPPPLGAGGGFGLRRKNKHPAREVVALDGLSLALANFPILQKAVLINPLVYASEGLRGTLVPQFPHLPMLAVLTALVVFDSLLLMLGLRQFGRKAVT